MKTVLLLNDSKFDPSGGDGKVVYLVGGKIFESSLIDLSKTQFSSLNVGFSLLNPLQTLYLMFYSGGNCLVCSPTSSGKTAIAVFFYLQNCSGGRFIYAAPTKSLVQEKFVEFRKVFGDVAIRTGDVIEDLRDVTQRVVVATYESLLSAARNKSKWFDDADVVVVDEVHLVMDASRGGFLEELVSYVLSEELPLLALSATVPGASELADWIKADLFVKSEWRPVPLERKIFNLSKLKAKIKKGVPGGMPAKIVSVVHSMKSPGKSIVFVPRKDYGWKAVEIENLYFDASVVNDTVPFLKKDGTNLVAFHNADVPYDERSTIERSFREGNLDRLYATQTLAYGVNLPADNVFIFVRGWYDRFEGVYKFFPDLLTVLQMEGRAGRFGFSSKGYSYIIVSGSKEKTFADLLEREMEKPFSTALSGGLFKEGKACGSKFRSVLSLMMLGPILRMGDRWVDAVKTMFSVRRNPFLLGEMMDIYSELEAMGYIVDRKLTKMGMVLASSFVSPFCYGEFLSRWKAVSGHIKSCDLRERSILWSFVIRPLIRKEFSPSTVSAFTMNAFDREAEKIRSIVYDYTKMQIDDDSDVFGFYSSGGFYLFPNVAKPPGELSFLKPESSLLAVFLSRANVFGFETVHRVTMMVRTGIPFDFALIGSHPGFGYMRGNAVARAAVYAGLSNEVAVLNAIKNRDRTVMKALTYSLEERYREKSELVSKELGSIVNIADAVSYPLGDIALLRFISSLFVGRSRALKLEKMDCLDILHKNITGSGGVFESQD